MANLEQPGSQLPDAWSVKLTFLLILIFYLRKTENSCKKSDTALTICQKMLSFCKKNAEIDKISWDLVLKGIFSGTTDVCVLTYQILNF